VSDRTFFATALKGTEALLADELKSLGAGDVRIARGGVAFQGPIVTAYRACLWCRTASRILMPLVEFDAADSEKLYQGVYAIPWEEHLSPDGTLAVDVTVAKSRIRHSRFATQRIKDAVVDRLRARFGRRPSVDREAPDLRVNGYLLNDRATIGLDLSGDSLHRRGYRTQTVVAPLKENLAAALLIKAGWPSIAAAGGALLDPLCGSGTLVIEAGLLAGDIAPGLGREYWGFLGWLGYEAALWEALLAEAWERRRTGARALPDMRGYDHDAHAVRAARINAERAGLGDRVRFEQRTLAELTIPDGVTPGLVIANPPYGERLGQREHLRSLYACLGNLLKDGCRNWQAAVFTANPDLGKRMGLRAQRINSFYNGALPCQLLRFTVEPRWFVDRAAADARKRQELVAAGAMFANRLRKNLRNIGRWAQREGIHCYRLYDADIPEYAVAIDRYEHWAHVQEYAPPPSVAPANAKAHLDQVMAVVAETLEIPDTSIFLKVRKPQKGLSQYQKQADLGEFFEVREGPCRFLVNLSDYLDTGLFLDHRPTRHLIGKLARGRRFLNLFGYTGAATVHAALGGAAATTTVDLSRTYLDWARRNMVLNGIGGDRHRLISADCLQWLEREGARYDLIFLDPPTFSSSKRMPGVNFDLQRDHVHLIRGALARLSAGGTLLFSNNFRKFKLDRDALADISIEDITARTIPKDFQRTPRVHGCWKITG
jgi:23S rRNA (guanine2445-N2)-methyltransferase / 23S rRNA (guanine2069-N7)-methyltransferase